MDIGTVGGLIGGGIGLLGGVIGTYYSIKNTSGPRERAYMIRFSALAWIAVTLFLAGLLLLPRPYNFLLWIPYGIALPLAITACNRRLRQIRAEEKGMAL